MKILFQYDTYYHIYNRGINSCPLFTEETNYIHFLGLWDKYISPIADTYAWALMGNHFHFLIKTKSDPAFAQPSRSLRRQTTDLEGLAMARKPLCQHFSNLFNAYTKAFNKRYNRTGALFEHNFRRKEVVEKDHLLYLIYYIHHNPVHHGFCDDMMDYPWSSFQRMGSPKASHLSPSEVIAWFQDTSNYKQFHKDHKIDILLNDLHLE